MEIIKNTVVTLDYVVRDPEGNVVDDGANPFGGIGGKRLPIRRL